jgi:PGF-pre-PGF domain-containing protein
LVLIFSILFAVCASADSPPPLPNTLSGTIKFANSSGQFDAPSGTMIEAFIDNVMKGSSIVETAGIYRIDVIGTNDDHDRNISFKINNVNADQISVFNASSPPPRTLDLIAFTSIFHVEIKIIPDSINPGNRGVIPVAILSTANFNATTRVNISSVRFGPWGANESHDKGHIDEDVNNDSFLDLVLHFDTQDTGIQCGDIQATLTGKTNDNLSFEGSDSFRTVGCEKSSTGGGSGSSGGGGGGGGTSNEDYSNIILKEKYEEAIYKDKPASYKFKNASNPVMFINITGNVNAGLINTAVEVLKGTSTLVNEDAPGIVYRNFNLWVGTSGFSTSKDIKEATVMFRVENTWIESNVLSLSEVKLVKWDNGTWKLLETSEKNRDGTYTYFEGKTTSFSPFAVTGIREAAPSATLPGVTVPAATTSAAPSAPPPPSNLAIILVVIVLIAVIVAVYIKRK